MSYFAAITRASAESTSKLSSEQPAWTATLSRIETDELAWSDVGGGDPELATPVQPTGRRTGSRPIADRSAIDEVSGEAVEGRLLDSTSQPLGQRTPVGAPALVRRAHLTGAGWPMNGGPADDRPVTTSIAPQPAVQPSTTPIRSDAQLGSSPLRSSSRRRGEVRLAERLVPAHVARREPDVRRWLSSNPQVLGVPAGPQTTVHIDRVIVEASSSAIQTAPTRELPQAKGFSEYDAIRRR